MPFFVVPGLVWLKGWMSVGAGVAAVGAVGYALGRRGRDIAPLGIDAAPAAEGARRLAALGYPDAQRIVAQLDARRAE